MRRAIAATIVVLAAPGLILAQGGGRAGRGGGGPAAPRDTTRGFPITDQVIVSTCTRCHTRDSSGVVQRISFLRKTPEGWEMSVRRMATLSHVQMTAEQARGIVRYLSNHQGLAPAEAKPGRFEAERRMLQNYRYTADATTETTCRACHSMGRVITQRRTRDEWELLVATHRGLYPDVDFQAFRRGGPAPPDNPAAAQHPMDAAIAHLSRVFPLRTPEWTAWSGTMRAPNIEGGWFVSGYEPGKGAFFGRATIAKVAGTDDEFTTKATYRYAKDGRSVTRTGKSIVYTGYQWRGRSKESAADTSGLREVMMIEPGWQEMSGRWFTGGYDELGADVTLTRAAGAPLVGGVSKPALRTNLKDQDLTIVGANLPLKVDTTAVDFGPGVHVTKVVKATADSITLKVSVDSGAAIGARDLFLAGTSRRAALVVYDKVSRIKVTPVAGLARTGGVRFPKQLQQFEAVAYHDGPDGKPDTADDFEIGAVDATWSLDEYGVTYNDDDVKYVGTLDQHGLFTPAVDGPNPNRSGSRNNVGDVWVVASWTPSDKGARALHARAQLIVTVPLYVKFDNTRTQP